MVAIVQDNNITPPTSPKSIGGFGIWSVPISVSSYSVPYSLAIAGGEVVTDSTNFKDQLDRNNSKNIV